MAFTARQVIQTAQATLQDAGAVRWVLPELLNYLNAGTREIALQKPTATSVTTTMNLVSGTKQTLPEGYHRLLGAIQNVGNGRVIKPIMREILDQHMPGWHSNTTLPFNGTVQHIIDDMFDTSVFYVCPGNDGTGEIEVIMSRLPAPIPAPSSPMDIESYTADVMVPDIYENCLVDYVCYRAFSKDIAVAGAAQRAQAHYQLFQQSLGIKTQVDMAQNVDTPKSRFSQ
ncbi:phage adaptor protein [Roseinatronobacter sp. NSM]|uniref:phage adaptor protein n=1 Tax=Roseinatronobacter sp. NSM TaxID=3457785 RepID=UPI004035A248